MEDLLELSCISKGEAERIYAGLVIGCKRIRNDF